MDQLDRSSVQRQLDAKLKIGGLAAFDLFTCIILALVMNLLFGETLLFIPMCLVLPVALLVFLHKTKDKRADGYLLHWVKFHTSEGIYLAAMKDEYEEKFYRRPYEIS